MRLLSEDEIEQQLAQTDVEWSVVGGHFLSRVFETSDFNDGVALILRLAEIANTHNHHPEICLEYSKVTLTLATHELGGLTDKDFQVAKAIDKLG